MDNQEVGFNTETLHHEITKMVNDEVSYIDALVYYAEKNDLELEVVGELVRRSVLIKAKVQEDAEKLNLVEKTNRLPFA